MEKALKDKLQRVGIEFEQNTGLFKLTERAYMGPIHFAEAGVSTSQMPESMPKVIYPVFRAMTGNKITLNCTLYPREQLIGDSAENTGLTSWIRPYEIPVIMNHQDSPGFFGGEVSEPLGRIVAARYEENSGAGYLALVPKIVDAGAIERVLDGRYHTLSIGVSATEVECSVCQQKLRSQGWCEHDKGETYEVKGADGVIRTQLCYYIIQGIRAREISFVLTPSDNEAQVVTPDLGEKGLKVWAAKSGTVSTVTEMSSGKNMTLAEVLKGFSLSESLQNSSKEKIDMPNTKKPVAKPAEDASVTTTVETETPEVPGTDAPATGFDSVEAIVAAAAELAQSETPDPELLTVVAEAIDKAGLSNDHLYRVALTAIEGIAVGTRPDGNTDEQKTLTPGEYVTQAEAQIAELGTISTEALATVETLTTERDTLKAQVDEFAQKTEAVLATEVESLKTQLAKEKAKAHSMLATSVAVEMKRSNSPIANGKTLEELSAQLAKRSEDSLTDTYHDLLALVSPSEESVRTVITPVTSPALTPQEENISEKNHVASLDKIRQLYEKHKTKLVEDVDGTKVPAVTEDEPAPVIIRTNADGTATVTEGSTPEDLELAEAVSKYTL